MSNICVENTLLNPKCYTLETFDFDSEEQIFDILLDLLKSELPGRLQKIQDCQGNPMYISEEDIDLIPSGKDSKFEIILNPVDAVPVYSENKIYRTVEYNFELIIAVQNEVLRCITWELTRFKNAIEGLIVAAEFVIDGYEAVEVEPKGFSYFEPLQSGGKYLRQGSYKFAVTVRQYKI